MAHITTSKKWTLNWMDIAKAGLLAALTPVLVLIQQSISEGQLVFHWKELGIAAVGGFVAYLIKNFFTPSAVKLTGEDVNIAVQAKSDAENKA